MTNRSYNLEGFKRVEVNGAIDADLSQSTDFSVNVTADDFPHLRVERVGDTLKIGRQGIEWLAPFHAKPRATITMPVLESIDISGASHVRMQGFQSDGSFAVDLSGASRIEMRQMAARQADIRASGASTIEGEFKTSGNIAIDISGASRLAFDGGADNISLKLTGASTARLDNFPVHDTDIEISGASTGGVNVNGKMNANISGASTLNWSGNAAMGDIRVSGASNLRRK